MADLKADDTGNAIVPVLACVLNQLCLRNDRLPMSQKGLSKFHALRPPAISIKDYLQRVAKYAACSGECFVLALVYIDRIIQSNPTFVVNSLNIHRLLITSIMLAAKFFDDSYFNNAYYAKVGGVPCNEINSLEVEFLFMCVASGTRVNVASLGLSLPIEKVDKRDSVLALASGGSSLTSRSVDRRLNKGVQECVQLLFQDGRTLTLTPNHKIRTFAGEWKRADKLALCTADQIGDAVAVGIELPQFVDDLPTEDFQISTLTFTALTRLNSLFVARISGLQLATNDLNLRATTDLQQLQQDIERITSQSPLASTSSSASSTSLPSFLASAIASLNSSAADYYLSSSCPVALVREFIGAFLGAQAQILPLQESKPFLTLDLTNKPLNATEMVALLQRCGVEKGVEVDGNIVTIGSAGVTSFAEHVGFRYNTNKQMRLTVAASYYRAVEYVQSQVDFINAAVVSRASDVNVEEAVHAAKAALEARGEFVHPDVETYQFKKMEAAESDASVIPASKMLLSLEEALTQSNLKSMLAELDSNDSETLPMFSMPLIGRRTVGSHQVWDLVVPSFSSSEDLDSFMAAGVCTHNCNFTLFVTTDTYSQYYTELCNHAQNTQNVCNCSSGPKVPPLVIPYVNSPGPGQTVGEWQSQLSPNIPYLRPDGVELGELSEQELQQYALQQQQQLQQQQAQYEAEMARQQQQPHHQQPQFQPVKSSSSSSAVAHPQHAQPSQQHQQPFQSSYPVQQQQHQADHQMH